MRVFIGVINKRFVFINAYNFAYAQKIDLDSLKEFALDIS